MAKRVAKVVKATKTVAKTGVAIAQNMGLLPNFGATAPATAKKKAPGKGKKRQTVAKIKRKIALIKAKKELTKIRGY